MVEMVVSAAFASVWEYICKHREEPGFHVVASFVPFVFRVQAFDFEEVTYMGVPTSLIAIAILVISAAALTYLAYAIWRREKEAARLRSSPKTSGS